MNPISLAERGRLPDALIRLGIRGLLRRRLADLAPDDGEAAESRREAFRRVCSGAPIALVPEQANAQHYELPPAFFEEVLGPRLKYSCGLWEDDTADLGRAEEAMLDLTCQRAGVADGMSLLDLGCGWGSLSLWLAERHPSSPVLAVSNSKLQREFILGRRDRQGLRNLEVITADVNHFTPPRRFDRVLSVEMFEHVRNHERLIARIADWLERDGRLFVHHFAHRRCAYPYETAGEDDWMGRHFFTGGMMPAHDQLLRCQRDLVVEHSWCVNGRHYQKTCEAWLERQDARRDALRPILAETYGEAGAELWHQRWRLFFMACSELFGFRGGNEWWVTHVRMGRPEEAS